MVSRRWVRLLKYIIRNWCFEWFVCEDVRLNWWLVKNRDNLKSTKVSKFFEHNCRIYWLAWIYSKIIANQLEVLWVSYTKSLPDPQYQLQNPCTKFQRVLNFNPALRLRTRRTIQRNGIGIQRIRNQLQLQWLQ